MKQENAGKNIYQLSGIDNKDRGFTRQVQVFSNQGFFHAVLRYEETKLAEKSCVDEDGALREIIQRLQSHGYTQLRSRLIFRGTHYLGSQEIWVDYPDMESSSELMRKVLDRLMQWFCFSKRKTNE